MRIVMEKQGILRFKFLLIVLLLLLLTIFRIMLPYFIMNTITHKVNQSTDYQIKIHDASINILAGSYTLSGIEIRNKKDLIFPLLTIKKTNIVLSLGLLLHGKLATKIFVDEPIININISDEAKTKSSESIESIWRQAVQPIWLGKIDQFRIKNGVFNFKKSSSVNKPILYIQNVKIDLNNMQRKPILNDLLPTQFQLTAKIMDSGDLNISGRANLFSSVPQFDTKGSLRHLSIPSLNEFLKTYTKIKAQTGNFDLFFEAAVINGKIKGYAKPFITNFKVKETQSNDSLQKLYEGAVTIAKKILENPQQKTVASQVNFSGNINNPNIEVLSVIFYLLQHAFIQALLPQIDKNISIKDVIYSDKK